MLLRLTLAKAKKLAAKEGWDFLEYQENIGMASFSKIFGGHPARLNIYLTKMTVTTCITHPVKGKTQLFRKNVSDTLLQRIFANPRVHTDKGYQRA